MKRILFSILLTLLIPAGCDDTLNLEGMTEQQIQALFVGEWKEIGRGNDTYPELKPSGDTITFRSDGTVGGTLPGGSLYDYYSEDKLFTYRVDAEFLYINGGGEDADRHTFRPKFTGRNKLRLDHTEGYVAYFPYTPNFLIYKRIK